MTIQTGKFSAYITYALLCSVIVFLFFSKSCHSPQPITKNDTLRTEKKIYDTTVHTITVEVPTPYKVETKVHDTLRTKADTIRVIGDYFKTRFYKQEFSDTNITATLFDTLSQNKFTGRHFTYKLLKPTTYITNTTITQCKPHNKVSAGIFTDFNTSKINSFGISGTFETKNGKSLQVGYSIVNPSLLIGLSSLISFRKK